MSVVAAVNPDVRPLPPNWSEHFDQRRSTWYYMRNDCDPPRKSYVHPLGPSLSDGTSSSGSGITRTMTFAQKLYASSISNMKPASTAPDVQPVQGNPTMISQNASAMAHERPFVHPPPPPPLNLPQFSPPVVVPSPPPSQQVSPSLQSANQRVFDTRWTSTSDSETSLAYLREESPVEESRDRWSSLYREEEEFERHLDDSGVSLQRSPTYASVAPRQNSLPSYPGPEPVESSDQLSLSDYFVTEDRVLQTEGPLPARAPSYSVSPSSPTHRSGPRSDRRVSGPRLPSSPIFTSPTQIETLGISDTSHSSHNRVVSSLSNDRNNPRPISTEISPSISPTSSHPVTSSRPIESPASSRSISSDTTSLPPGAAPPNIPRYIPSQTETQPGVTVTAQEPYLSINRQWSPQETRLSPKRPVTELYTYASAPPSVIAPPPALAVSPQSNISTQSRSPIHHPGHTPPAFPHSSTTPALHGTSNTVNNSNMIIPPPPGRIEQQPHVMTFSSAGGNTSGTNARPKARPLPHRASAPLAPPARSTILPIPFEQSRLPVAGVTGDQPRLTMNTTVATVSPTPPLTSQIRSPVTEVPPPPPPKLPSQPPMRPTQYSVPVAQQSPVQVPPSVQTPSAPPLHVPVLPQAPPQVPLLPPRQFQQFAPYTPAPPQQPQNKKGLFGSSSNSHLIRNGLLGGVAGLAGAAILNQAVTGSPTVDGGTISNLVSGMANLMGNSNSDNNAGPDLSSYTTDNSFNVDPSSYAVDQSAFGNPAFANSSSAFDPSSFGNPYQQYDQQQQPFSDPSSYQQYDQSQQQQPFQTQMDQFQQQSENEMKIFNHQLEARQKEEEAVFRLQQQQMQSMESFAKQQQATILQQQQQIQQLNQQLQVNPTAGATAGVAATGELGAASHVMQNYPQSNAQGNQPHRPYIQTANLTANTGGPSNYTNPISAQQSQFSYNPAGIPNGNVHSQHSVGHSHNAFHNMFNHSVPQAAGPSAIHQQQMYHSVAMHQQAQQQHGGFSGLVSKIPPSVSTEVGKLAVTGAIKLFGNAMTGFNNNNN